MVRDFILANPSVVSQGFYLLAVMVFFYLLVKFNEDGERKRKAEDARRRYLDDVRDIIRKNKKGTKDLFDAIQYFNDFKARRR